MPARSHRIIHQQAQVSSFETSLTVILRAKGLCRCQNILNNNRHLDGFHQTVAGKYALAVRPCNCEAVLELLLPKVVRCIPVLSSRYIGKCAARVLKRSALNLRTTVAFATAHLEIFHCTHHPVIPKSDLYFLFNSPYTGRRSASETATEFALLSFQSL